METGKKNAPEIEIQGVTKSYETREGSFLALEEVNLDVEKNEFICVVGPSGCGKTTLMNIIAGLNPPSTGTVKVRGESVTGPGKGKGVVFQQYALYPWLTVEKNVEFGLRMKGVEGDCPKIYKDCGTGKICQVLSQGAVRGNETESGHCQSLHHRTGGAFDG